MSTKKTIAIVEDEEDIQLLLKHNLETEYNIELFSSGDIFIEEFQNGKLSIDLLLLDLMLPGLDGLEICKILRNCPQGDKLPIIILTAKSEEIDKILGLEFGADDYITKPFSIRELKARIKAVLRRVNNTNVNSENLIINSNGIIMDTEKIKCEVNNTHVDLTLKEFKLLHLLITNTDKVFSREQIISKIWGDDVYITFRTVDVHITQLRKKLGKLGNRIKSIRGLGYKYSSEE